MESIIPGLYASAPQWLPFAPSLDARAFLLRRKQGNLLVYSVAELDSQSGVIRNLGGVARRYLSHRHEAMFVSGRISAPIYCHENEVGSVAMRTEVGGTFSDRHMLDEDFEVIPIPGHTRGASAFLWETGEHRILFTGDTIYLDEGEWVATVLDSSDRASYLESLKLIRGLAFDVLVPWAATHGRPCCAVTDRSDAEHRIDAIIDRVRRGDTR